MIEQTMDINTADGQMGTFLCHPERGAPYPAVCFLMDAHGIREELRDMARRLAAQEALGSRTDAAPAPLAWSRAWRCRDSPFAHAGIDRMVQERLPIPGDVVVAAGPLVTPRLKTPPPLVKPMLVCRARLGERVGDPGILRKS